MLKRPRDLFDTPVSSSPPYSKRLHLSDSSEAASSSAFSSPLKPYQLSFPADSPSNPFSLKLNNVVTLPRNIPFSKYFALRFQLVPETKPVTRRTKASSYRNQPKESYRIVHVPPNYSFKLLYKLIRFLFDLEAGPDHVFEVQEGVEMYAASANKVGKIKKGQTGVKLSRNFDDQLKGLVGKGKGKKIEEECQWEGEDDFLVATAWPDGLVEERAVIYRHDTNKTIHITMNTLDFPTRKGSSNRPFVFLANTGEEDYDYWNGKRSFEKFLRTSLDDVPEEEEETDDDDFPLPVPSSDSILETPYPSAPLQQLRIESSVRRMSRKLPKSKHQDDSGSDSESESDKEPTKPEAHGEDWDPFGDEAEL